MTPKQRSLYSLLGFLPDRNAPLSVHDPNIEQREGYVLEKLSLRIHDEAGTSRFHEMIPLYFAYPGEESVPPGKKLPAVLFCHSHGGRYELGKDELLLGNTYMPEEPYVSALTRRGYCVLAFDAWGFGERFHQVSESEIFKDMLWWGESLWGHMVYDGLRAFDFLLSRPEVDPARVATLGMSMGSTLSYWIAALESRVKVCVDLCCQTDIDTLAEQNGFDLHGLYYYVPGLRRAWSTGDIDALIAPRPHLCTAGTEDALTPEKGLQNIEKRVRPVYEACGAPDNFVLKRYPVGHFESAKMRADVLSFLQEHL